MKNQVICLLLVNKKERLLELAEACYRFTPQIALRSGEAIFLDVSRSLSLFKNRDSLLQRIRVLCRRFDLNVNFGVAEDPASALALARFQMTSASQLPLEAMLDYVNPFEDLRATEDSSFKELVYMVSVLNHLGVKKLEDFRLLPEKSLSVRFGKMGARLSQWVRYGFQRPWPQWVVPQRIFEEIDFSDQEDCAPCTQWDSFLFSLKEVLVRLVSRLKGRNLRASSIELKLYFSKTTLRKKKSLKYKIEFSIPQGSVLGLLAMIQTRIEFDYQKKVQSPIEQLRVEVTETAPGHGSQRNFFNRKEEEAESWDSLISRLSSRLGEGKVFLAQSVDRYLPESAWKKVEPKELPQRVQECPSESVPLRPSRMLNPPERLERKGSYFIQARSQRKWKVLEWEGPESLSGEWWTKTAFHRNYYRILTDQGEKLWVFSVPHFEAEKVSNYYLHGYFD